MKQQFTPYIYILFFLLNFGFVFGQKLILKVSAKDSTNTVLINTIHYQKVHFSKISLDASLDSIHEKLERKGFLNVSLDTLIKKDTVYFATFNLKNRNKTIRIYYAKKDVAKKTIYKIVPHAKVEDGYFEVPLENLSEILDAFVTVFEAQGNSFTQVSLQKIQVEKRLINAQLMIKKSRVRKIDKVVINGYKEFPKTFLRNFLHLQPTTLFSRKKLNESSKLIAFLPFVTEMKPPEVLFTKDSTILYLYLKKKISNKFDGLVGFTSKENGNGILFNGYLDLALHNIFDGGESFSIYWKNNGNDRQVFDLNLKVPYIFNARFSPSVELNIYKQDSSFISTKTKLNVPYIVNERLSLGISLQSENSTNLLTSNGDNINDFKTSFYGINYAYQIFNNNVLFPTKFSVFGEFLSGKKKNTGNTTNQTKLYLKTIYLWYVSPRSHLYLQNETSTLLSDNILVNELFRIGGVNSIRGFNEESIFASTYSYFNIEYRYNTNTSSYLYSITDVGYIDNETIQQSSQIYSLGLGYAFTTKLGVLNLSYAIGNFSSRPFDINNSRFHVKIVSFF